MIVLQEKEMCSLSGSCPYNKDSNCQGAKSDRKNVFTCDYVTNGKITEDGSVRNANDKTGRMQVIMG